MKTAVQNITPGKVIDYHGEPCLVLEHRKDGTLLLHLEQMTHAFGSTNNFAASSLRAHLNGPYLRSLTDGSPDEVITRTVDLTALNGSTEYGTCDCKVAPLTLDELRKYHDILPLPPRTRAAPTSPGGCTPVAVSASSSATSPSGPAPLSSFPPPSPWRLRTPTPWSSTPSESWRRSFSAASATKG